MKPIRYGGMMEMLSKADGECPIKCSAYKVVEALGTFVWFVGT
jgi:uncharacterized protein YaiI (UPF0178 family)